MKKKKKKKKKLIYFINLLMLPNFIEYGFYKKIIKIQYKLIYFV